MVNRNDQPMYSWYGTPLHIPCSERMADAYNRRLEQFQEAQKEYYDRTGKRWDGRAPLMMQKDVEASEAYNKIGKIINLLVDLCGGSITGEFNEEFMENNPDGLTRIN